MAFLKRLTTRRKLISTHCQELGNDKFYTDKMLSEYLKTLDIDKLGKHEDLVARHTIFTVSPLSVDNEKFVDNIYVFNAWEIFRRHVHAVENWIDPETGKDIEIKWENNLMTDDCRELIFPEVVEDIARMIISLANNDGVKKLHTARATFTADLRTWRIAAG